MRFSALILMGMLAAAPLWAAPARISTGEHDGFTRLVVDLGNAAPWSIGRTDQGYELRIDGDAPQYDLSAAFDVIARSRIADLSVDTATGALQVVVGCNCHVAPFEFRPGIVVLDLKDGPPPEGSPYEARLDVPAAETALASVSPPAPANILSSAWIDRALGQEPMQAPAKDAAAQIDPAPQILQDLPPPDPNTKTPPAETPPAETQTAGPPATAPEPGNAEVADAGLAPLREELMREISRGAAQGVVTMELPKPAATPEGAPVGDEPAQARLGLGALPQVRIEGRSTPPQALAAEGQICPSDVQLDIASWGDDRPIWEQISEARSGLSGEFDRPDPEAIDRAIKFHLFIGFGRETIGLIKGFGATGEEEGLWSSIAHILDEVPDPDPAFAGMANCDSAAALWAVLADPAQPGQPTNLRALQRSFSALPSHLRQTLGARLVERLMAMGAGEAVDVVRNAILRAGAADDRGIALMEAEVAAEAGKFEKADDLLQPLLDDPGPQTQQALVARIEGQAARALPMPAQTVPTIEAYASEREGGPEGPAFHRALILALALTGDFRRAFAEAPPEPALQSDLWRLLASLGTDDVILEQAAIAPGAVAPAEARAVAADFATRFLTVGLPDQARKWMAAAENIDRLLAARIAFATHDGRSALTYLEGIDGAEAEDLRIAALQLAGDEQALAAAFAEAGDGAAATAALARARDWEGLRQDGQAVWGAAAQTLTAQAAAETAGPMAEGTALADQALGTRDAVRALLASVPGPEIKAP